MVNLLGKNHERSDLIIGLIVIAVILLPMFGFIAYSAFTMPASVTVENDANKEIEIQRQVDQMKARKSERDALKPDQLEKPSVKEVYIQPLTPKTPTVGMSRIAIESICGPPDHRSSRTTSAGTINAYTYRFGNCKGVWGFDIYDKSIVIDSY